MTPIVMLSREYLCIHQQPIRDGESWCS